MSAKYNQNPMERKAEADITAARQERAQIDAAWLRWLAWRGQEENRNLTPAEAFRAGWVEHAYEARKAAPQAQASEGDADPHAPRLCPGCYHAGRLAYDGLFKTAEAMRIAQEKCPCKGSGMNVYGPIYWGERPAQAPEGAGADDRMRARFLAAVWTEFDYRHACMTGDCSHKDGSECDVELARVAKVMVAEYLNGEDDLPPGADPLEVRKGAPEAPRPIEQAARGVTKQDLENALWFANQLEKGAERHHITPDTAMGAAGWIRTLTAALDASPRVEGVVSAVAGASEDRFYRALVWALGAGGEFRLRKDGEGPYWWRGELATRAGLEWNGERYVYDGEPSAPAALRGPSGQETAIRAAAWELREAVMEYHHADGSITLERCLRACMGIDRALAASPSPQATRAEGEGPTRFTSAPDDPYRCSGCSLYLGQHAHDAAGKKSICPATPGKPEGLESHRLWGHADAPGNTLVPGPGVGDLEAENARLRGEVAHLLSLAALDPQALEREALARSAPPALGGELEAAEGILWDLQSTLYHLPRGSEEEAADRVREAAEKVLALGRSSPPQPGLPPALDEQDALERLRDIRYHLANIPPVMRNQATQEALGKVVGHIEDIQRRPRAGRHPQSAGTPGGGALYQAVTPPPTTSGAAGSAEEGGSHG